MAATRTTFPRPGLAARPFHVNLATLHVERPQLDDEILKMVLDQGVTLVRDRVVDLETDGGKDPLSRNESGTRFLLHGLLMPLVWEHPLMARNLIFPQSIRSHESGDMGLFQSATAGRGNDLYMDALPTEYLEWIWEIPVSPDTVSVGYISPGAAVKDKREKGLSVEDIFRQQLMKFARFEPLLQQGANCSVNVTSFRCRVHLQCAGDNWLIAGEAAALVDPMTSNGVTAALRHANEAAALILKFREREAFPFYARKAYSSRILQMAKFFNEGIEKMVYEPQVRNRISLGTAGRGLHESGMEHERRVCAFKPAWFDRHFHIVGHARILSDRRYSLLLVLRSE